MSPRRTRKDDGSQWTVADSRSVYGIRHWGAGYFAISDAGNVEAGPDTTRYGVELAAYWRPADWFTFDAELAFSEGRYDTSGRPAARGSRTR